MHLIFRKSTISTFSAVIYLSRQPLLTKNLHFLLNCAGLLREAPINVKQAIGSSLHLSCP